MRNKDREAEQEKQNGRVGEFIESLRWGQGCRGLEGGIVTGLNIRMPTDANPEALVVVKVEAAGEAYVGFVGALTLHQALLTWRAKDGSGGLKWRVDEPWQPTGG